MNVRFKCLPAEGFHETSCFHISCAHKMQMCLLYTTEDLGTVCCPPEHAPLCCHLFQCPGLEAFRDGSLSSKDRVLSSPTVNGSCNHKPSADPGDPLRLAAPHYLVSVRMWLQISGSHEIILGLSLEHTVGHRERWGPVLPNGPAGVSPLHLLLHQALHKPNSLAFPWL